MIHVIINPVAGSGLALKAGRSAISYLKTNSIAFTYEYTSFPGHAIELAADAARKNIETVISVGGDGTAYEVSSGLAGSKTALGIIPAGTGNDVIKTLNVPKKPIDALKVILQNNKIQMDLGKINDNHFINVCGVGFDVSVLENSLNVKKYVRGIFPYLYGIIKALITFKPISIDIIIDGIPIKKKNILMFAVANGKFIGGGIPIAPKASINDNLLDVVLVNTMPNYKLIKYLPALLKGKILSFPFTEHYLCKSAIIEGKDVTLNVDGELFKMDRVLFALSPNSLWVHI